jgi:hypothetical protein
MTLYRYLEDKPESWYVAHLVLEQSETARVPRRIMVLEQQANLIETQKLRLNRALEKEHSMDGHLTPEVRANIELTNRLLNDHLRNQQAVGLEPKVTPAGQEPRGARSASDTAPEPDPTTKALLDHVVNLPEGEFIPTLVALIGPPPVKQPLHLGEATVVERRPLTPVAAADRGAEHRPPGQD